MLARPVEADRGGALADAIRIVDGVACRPPGDRDLEMRPVLRPAPVPHTPSAVGSRRGGSVCDDVRVMAVACRPAPARPSTDVQSGERQSLISPVCRSGAARALAELMSLAGASAGASIASSAVAISGSGIDAYRPSPSVARPVVIAVKPPLERSVDVVGAVPRRAGLDLGPIHVDSYVTARPVDLLHRIR